jgi:hypothetical protein
MLSKEGKSAVNSLPRQLSHLLECLGLAMVGAAAGLFVGIHTGIDVLTNQNFLIAMTIVGTVGFYLGIDTPRHRFQGVGISFPGYGTETKIDSAELLTAAGTLLAALAAFTSVLLIVFGREGRVTSSAAILTVWVVGVAMQVGAGSIARLRR